MTLSYGGAPRERAAKRMTGEEKETAGDYLSLDSRKKKYEEAQQLSETSRRMSEQDRDYYDHKQWTASEIAKLKLRGQVPIVINRIQRKVDTIVGIQERSQVDPNAAPRNPNDEQAGEVATDSVRYVCDANQFKAITLGMFKHLCIEGTTGAEVCVEEKGGKIEIIIKKVRWETAFWDGHSREEDFSDAQHLGTATWMYVDDIEQMFGKEARKVAEDSLQGMGVGGMAWGVHEDRPTFGQWLDYRNKRVLVVDMYCKYKGQWTRSVFCSGGDLIEPVVSEYTDEHGDPVCPLELVSVYIDRENSRYGLVRGMIGPQDEINYRRSKFLHLVSTRQTFGNQAAIDNVDKAKRELGKPHGHVELSGMAQYGKDFGVIDTTDMAQGQLEMLQEAKMEIDLLGPNSALQGRDTKEDAQSGKAWLAQQQAGLAELAALYSAFNNLMLRVYKQVWWRIRQYWDAPRYVRVSDNANAYRFTLVNEPVVDEMGQPVYEIDQATGQYVLDEQGMPVQKMTNRPAELDVDITFENVPDTSTLMEEQFEKLVRLAEIGAPIPPDVIIEASNIRNKREILDRLRQPPPPPQPPPEKMAELELEKQEIDLHAVEVESSARLKDAQARKANEEAKVAVHKGMADARAAIIKAMQPPAPVMGQPRQGGGQGAQRNRTNGSGMARH